MAIIKNRNCCAGGSLLCTGIVFLLMGILLPPFVHKVIEDGLDEELIVASFDDPLYEEWLTNEDSDDPAEYYRMYVWNCTNINDVVTGAVPVIEEVGPYMYRQYKRKITLDGEMGVLWGDDGSWSAANQEGTSARYTPYNFVKFDRQASTDLGLPTWRDPTVDKVCTVNKIYAGTVAVANGIAEGAVYNAGDRYFYCQEGGPDGPSVETLMFGRPEPYVYNYTDPQDAIDLNMEWAFNTGLHTRKEVRRQLMWKNTKQVEDLWFLPEDGSGGPVRPNQSEPWYEFVRGTDASQFPRKLEFGQRLDVWEKDIIRTVYLRNYNDEESTYKDIELMNFRVEPETYYSCGPPDNYETNCVFDMYQSGLINLEVIAAGIPLFASQAHQYAVDPQYVNVIGQNPDINKHTSFINVEPYTGITMNAGKVAQIQIRVGPTTCFNTSLEPVDQCDPACSLPCPPPCQVPVGVRPDNCFGTCPVDGPEICPYANVIPNTYLPVFWYVEGGSINDAKADEFKAGVVFGRGFITFSEIFFNILGPLMIIGGAYFLSKYHAELYTKRDAFGTLGTTEERTGLINSI